MAKYDNGITDKIINSMLDGAEIYKTDDDKFVVEFSVYSQSWAGDAKDESEAKELASEWLKNVPESFIAGWQHKQTSEEVKD